MSGAHAHGAECVAMAERLSEYLDRELDPAACSKLEEHLDDCPPCKVFLESLRRTVGLVREAPTREALSEDVKRRIVEAYRKISS